MKRFRYFSTGLMSITANTDHTRLLLERTVKNALVATKSNLNDARLHWKRGDADYNLAKKYFEEAVKIADALHNDKNALNSLDKEDKKILSATYAGYADFLRETTLSEKYGDKGGLRELLDRALKLNPENEDANKTDRDVKFNHRM